MSAHSSGLVYISALLALLLAGRLAKSISRQASRSHSRRGLMGKEIVEIILSPSKKDKQEN